MATANTCKACSLKQSICLLYNNFCKIKVSSHKNGWRKWSRRKLCWIKIRSTPNKLDFLLKTIFANNTFISPWLPRTFCFPGVFGPNTRRTARFLICCPPWTQAVLSSPLWDICHSTVQLWLALTTTWRPGPLAKQTSCLLYAQPCDRLCPLLMNCRNCSQFNYQSALDLNSNRVWRAQQGNADQFNLYNIHNNCY